MIADYRILWRIINGHYSNSGSSNLVNTDSLIWIIKMTRYNKHKLALELVKIGIPYSTTQAFISMILERIKAALIRGETIEFRNFGTWKVYDLDLPDNLNKKGHNKKRAVQIKFKPAQKLKNLVKEAR